MQAQIQVGVLGSLRVINRNGPVNIGAAQQRIVLATLATNAGNEVPAGTFARAIWMASPPPSMNVTVRGLFSKVRRAIDPGRELIVTKPGGYGENECTYRLNAQRDDIDMFAAENLHKSGLALIRDEDWEQAYATFTKAKALWRGDPFLDVPSEYLHGRYARYLENLRAEIRTAQLEALVRLSPRAAGDAVPELWLLIEEYPDRENPRKLLMLALYRTGRQREALSVFRQWWDYLRDEIGAKPSPGIQSLNDRIAVQDAALLAESLGFDAAP